MSTQNAVNRHHYFLLSGQVIFTLEGHEEPQSAPSNTVYYNDGKFSITQLTRAQQALVHRVTQLVGGPIGIIDVIIQDIIPLGEFTEEEFYDQPKAKPKLSVVSVGDPVNDEKLNLVSSGTTDAPGTGEDRDILPGE